MAPPPAEPKAARPAPGGLAWVAAERRRAVLTATPLLALTSALAALAAPFSPGPHPLDIAGFWAIAGALLLAWWLTLTRRLSDEHGRVGVLALVGTLVGGRIVSVFLGAAESNATHSVFFSVYAFIPIYFTLFTGFLPYPQSARYGALAWLAVTALTMALCRPYFGGTTPHEGLVPLMVVVWAVYPVLLLLINNFARGQQQLLRQHAAEADSAREADRQHARSAQKLEAIFNQAAVGFALLDSQGKWLQVNRRLCEIVGYSEAELLQLDFQTITHPDDLQKDVALADQVMRGIIDTYSMEKRYLRKDRGVVWINLSVARMPAATREEEFFISVVEDISARKQAEAAHQELNLDLEQRIAVRTAELRVSTERAAERSRLLERTTAIVGMLPSAHDEAEACAIVTDALPQILPQTRGTLFLCTGDEVAELRTTGHWGAEAGGADFLAERCWGVRRGQPHLVTRQNGLLRCGHAAHLPRERASLCLPLTGAGGNGGTLGMLHVEWRQADALTETDLVSESSLLRAVSEQLALALANLRLRERLQSQAMNDPLTGLHNRRHLETFLNRSLATSKRDGQPLAVLIVDVDHFKRFNDDHGHDAGDLVLTAVAQALARSVREGDLAFRYGGEEFVLVLNRADPAVAGRCAERIMGGIRGLRLAHAGRVLPPITVSIGLAVSPQDGLAAEPLLRAADKALYQAKLDGRNRSVFSESLTLQNC